MQILLEHQRTFENKQFVFCWLGNKRQGSQEAITPFKACVVNTHCHRFLGFLECLSLQQMFCWEIHVREINWHLRGYRVKLLYRLIRYLDPEFAIGGTSYYPILSCWLPSISFFHCCSFFFVAHGILYFYKNPFCKSVCLPQRLLLTQYQLTQTTWVSGSGAWCPHFPHSSFYLPILNQNLGPNPFFCYVA